MGYYSDVGLLLNNKGIRRLKYALKNHISGKVKNDVHDLFSSADIHHVNSKSKAEVWIWKCIKWYANDPYYFPEIDFIEKFIGKLKNTDFRFIRIGEEYSDVEVYGDFYDSNLNLEINRSINYEYCS